MADDFHGYDDHREPKGRDNLFLWTVFILFLIGIAFACWLGSFYIFSHPEEPRSYRLLKKLGKIEPPRRFEVTAGPPGEFLGSQKLFEKYSKFTRLELERENAELIRNYLKNYRETKKLVCYVAGQFTIIDSFELKKDDIFGSGVVALAVSKDVPKVLVEHVYTSAPEHVPALRKMLQTGLDMKIARVVDLSAVVHVEKIADGRLLFTVVPLLYGTYALKQGIGTFSLEPPPDLNMDGGLPVIKGPILQEGLKGFAEYRRKYPIASADPTPDSTPPPKPELVRIDTVEPGTTVPGAGAMPPVAIATPFPIGKSTPRIAVAVPVATPPISVAMLATPLPMATPIPVATPLPRLSPQGVPLQPFIAAAPVPGSLPTVGSWRTYAPGRVPPARAITPGEAGELADRGDLGERIYLKGDFRVTASGENRAVLRDRSAPTDAPKTETTRIIVEYPAGAVPPTENAMFARDASTPYEVRDIRRGADGQVNIYVREIIQQ